MKTMIYGQVMDGAHADFQVEYDEQTSIIKLNTTLQNISFDRHVLKELFEFVRRCDEQKGV